MELQILDTKSEGNSTCYLCKVDLLDYVRSIPEDYRDFDIQRGIVSNKYLDHLAITISNKQHIPPIVLVAEESEIKKGENEGALSLSSFKVLDGLQRTHRLNVISETLGIILDPSHKEEIKNNAAKFSRRNAKELRNIGSNSKLFQSLIELGAINLSCKDEFFTGNSLWIELWEGLDDKQKIKKMLLLNAGHKSVNIKHQLEIIFTSVKEEIDNITSKKIEIVKEKDISAIQYSKTRSLGQYHFSHVISALISMSAGKIVNTNNDFVADIQSGKVDQIDLIDVTEDDLLREFIELLYKLDVSVSSNYTHGKNWIGREVVLVGLFGAIGAYSNESNQTVVDILKYLSLNIDDFVCKLKIEDFENTRNRVLINKVNLGNVNKKAVYMAVFDILSGDEFKGWDCYFGVL